MDILKRFLPHNSDEIYQLVSSEFDFGFYKETNPDLGKDTDLVKHYIKRGWEEGCDPAPYFSSAYYLVLHKDVRDKKINPFYHYLAYGKEEGRGIQNSDKKSTNGSNDSIDLNIPSLISKLTGNTLNANKRITSEQLSKRVDDFFDVDYYIENNPDLQQKSISPLTHYIKYGWREKRKPNPWYSDNLVEAKQIKSNPATPPFIILLSTVSETELDSYKTRLCFDAGHHDCWPCSFMKPYFDSVYYHKKYPDIGEESDALAHYCEHGWKELRDPSPFFNTSYYLQSYSDIREAGINPFVHYLTEGLDEGRKPQHDDPVNTKLLKLVKTIDVASQEYSRLEPEIKLNSSESLFLSLINSLQKHPSGLLVSISNDNYLKHTGGIQKFISSESTWAAESKLCYIHICPTQPKLKLVTDAVASAFLVNCTVANEFIGTFTLTELSDVLNKLEEKYPKTDVLTVIHSVMGWDLSLLNGLIFEKSKNIYFYMHDYFSLCPEYRLLRNGIEPCDAPGIDSGTCAVCIHKTLRKEYINYFTSFFNSINAKIIFPSASAQKIFTGSGLFDKLETTVIPHIDIMPGKSGRQIIDNKKSVLPNSINRKKIRIAFCGEPVGHKGFFHYERILDVCRNNNSLEFFHLGSSQSDVSGLEFKKVALKKGQSVMSAAIREAEVDVIFLGSTWRETFNFVAYEALQAGAAIIALNSSGNVVELINTYRVGAVVKSWQEAIELLSDKDIVSNILKWKGVVASLNFSDNKSIFTLDTKHE
jgi:hypothetical protein